MGKCFLYGNAGGSSGSSSGLKVVTGLSEPTNPKENMVWVKSDKAGKKYVFAENEPESPAEGLIWFLATTGGAITKAYVYTDGEWKLVDVYMYLSGAWVHITVSGIYLYNNGDTFSSITGGWATFQWYGNKEFPGANPGLSQTETHLAVTYGGKSGLVYTQSKIPLADIQKISVVINSSSSNNNAIAVSNMSTGAPVGFPGNVIASKSLSNGTTEFDVSAISGNYHVGFKVESNFNIESVLMSY